MLRSFIKSTGRHIGKMSLKEAKCPCEKPRGGQKLTWLKQIEKYLETVVGDHAMPLS